MLGTCSQYFRQPKQENKLLFLLFLFFFKKEVFVLTSMLFEDKGVIPSYQIVLSIKFIHSTRKQHSEGERDLIIFILCVCMRVRACHSVCGGQRINLWESIFFLPSCGFRCSNSGHRAWQQAFATH